jgi:hypothetical protein
LVLGEPCGQDIISRTGPDDEGVVAHEISFVLSAVVAVV